MTHKEAADKISEITASLRQLHDPHQAMIIGCADLEAIAAEIAAMPEPVEPGVVATAEPVEEEDASEEAPHRRVHRKK